jgi:hypothetical protein
MWLGHDDELNPTGLEDVCTDGRWPLPAETMMLGPWVVRHESIDALYQGSESQQDEVWTCFPDPLIGTLPAIDWVCDQLIRPTYLNLTGGIFPFSSLLAILDFWHRKTANMRAEMTLATAPGTHFISEFPEPVVIVYGRADSDRATIPARHARSDDRHLVLWLARYVSHDPRAMGRFIKTLAHLASLRGRVALGRASLPAEEWVRRP